MAVDSGAMVDEPMTTSPDGGGGGFTGGLEDFARRHQKILLGIGAITLVLTVYLIWRARNSSGATVAGPGTPAGAPTVPAGTQTSDTAQAITNQSDLLQQLTAAIASLPAALAGQTGQATSTTSNTTSTTSNTTSTGIATTGGTDASGDTGSTNVQQQTVPSPTSTQTVVPQGYIPSYTIDAAGNFSGSQGAIHPLGTLATGGQGGHYM